MAYGSAAMQMIADALVGGEAFNKFDGANAHLGVGNSGAAGSTSHADLQGASKVRKPMESGYPQRSMATVTFRSIYGNSDANFEWLEWALFNAGAAGQMLNRETDWTSAPGTKTSDETWVLTVTVTPTAG